MSAKIFCIGFNKTGTSTLHQLFLNNGLSSVHNPSWWYWTKITNFENFVCFTDGFEGYVSNSDLSLLVFPNLNFLNKNFPGCKFILNTRSLDRWLISRMNHTQLFPEAYLKGYTKNEIDDEVIYGWIRTRNIWYTKIKQFFAPFPDQFLIVNVERDSSTQLIEKISNFIGRTLIGPIPHVNQTEVTKKNENKVRKLLSETNETNKSKVLEVLNKVVTEETNEANKNKVMQLLSKAVPKVMWSSEDVVDLAEWEKIQKQ